MFQCISEIRLLAEKLQYWSKRAEVTMINSTVQERSVIELNYIRQQFDKLTYDMTGILFGTAECGFNNNPNILPSSSIDSSYSNNNHSLTETPALENSDPISENSTTQNISPGLSQVIVWEPIMDSSPRYSSNSQPKYSRDHYSNGQKEFDSRNPTAGTGKFDNFEVFDRCCLHCGVKETPEWRKGPLGPKTLCNACGLQYSKNLKVQKSEAGKVDFILNDEDTWQFTNSTGREEKKRKKRGKKKGYDQEMKFTFSVSGGV